MKRNVYFVSGTGTGIGKSYATGYIARLWNGKGIRTITQKLIQTGNREISEDIELHRRIMGCPLLPEDIQKLTMPEIFSYPCSPHLAAEIDGRQIDFGKIDKATEELSRRYDAVLLEGAGGLMVPLTRQYLTIDYVADHGYPLVYDGHTVILFYLLAVALKQGILPCYRLGFYKPAAKVSAAVSKLIGGFCGGVNFIKKQRTFPH